MKQFTKALCIAALLSGLIGHSSAEVFRMKDGSKIEGSISLETADSYILLVEVKKGIRDQVTIKKSDVRYKMKSKAKKPQKSPDQAQAKFEALKGLLPTADLMTADDYDELLSKRIEPLLKRYPNSEHKDIAIDLKVSLLEEQTKVSLGEIKFNGEWLGSDEVAANQFEIDAAQISRRAHKHLAKKDYPAALAALSALQNGYQNTDIFHKLLDECLEIIPLYLEQAQQIIDDHAKVVEERDKKLERLSAARSKKLAAKLKREGNAYKQALADMRKSKNKWLPLYRFDPKTAERAITQAQRELKKLEALKGAQYTDASTLYRDLLVAIDSGELKEAQSLSRQFNKARPPRPVANHVRSLFQEAKAADRQRKKDLADTKRRLKEEAKLKAKEEAEKPKDEQKKDEAPADKKAA